MRFPRPTRRVIGWLAAGVALYLSFLVVYFPAPLLTHLLAKATQNRVAIAAATGSVWRGQGLLTMTPPGAAPISLGTIGWDLRLPYLFLARVQIDMTLSDGPISGSASVVRTIRSIQLRSLSARFPATQLAILNPLLAAANLRGDVTLTAPVIRLSRFGLHGAAMLTWTDAGSENFGLDHLGDYQINVSGDMKPLQIVVSTVKGDVALSGEGSWDTEKSGRLQLGLTIAPGGRQPALGPMLQTWTKPLGDKKFRYDLDTTVPVPRQF